MKIKTPENRDDVRALACEIGVIYDPWDPTLPCWQDCEV